MIDRRLQLLRVLAECGTITETARILYRTPSGVSQQLADLAKELDVNLLEHEGRRVRLSPAARYLVAEADALQARWENALTGLTTQRSSAVDVIRVAAFTTAISAVVAPAVIELADREPALSVQAIEAEPREAFDLLLTNEADLALTVARDDTPTRQNRKFAQKPLFREPIDLIVPPTHPLAGQRSVELSAAAEEPWIVGTSFQYGRQEITDLCHAAGFTPCAAHYAQDWTAVASLVSRGLGVSLASRLALLPSPFAVARVPLAGHPTPSRHLLASTRAGAEDHPAVVTAVDVLRSVAEHQISSSQ